MLIIQKLKFFVEQSFTGEGALKSEGKLKDYWVFLTNLKNKRQSKMQLISENYQ
jgi:hypothetical protein